MNGDRKADAVPTSTNIRFILVIAYCAFAMVAMAQTPVVSPATVGQGDEAFVEISLAGLLATDYVLVTFTGPAGSSGIEPQVIVDGSLVVWVPVSTMNSPGTYSVYVDVTREGATTRYGPTQLTVNVLSIGSGSATSLTLPEVVTAEASSAAGAIVTFSTRASDGSPVSCIPASGSLFPVGTSSVTCSAGDASGSFSVLVYDTGRPVLTVPADISTSNAVVRYTVSASDAVDPAPTVECIPLSGSTFPFGATVVECTAVDQHANSDFRTFRVTVTNGAPVTITNLTLSEAFFSPNADGNRDATTVAANAPSADTAWTVTVMSPSGTTVRTANLSGAALSFTWDGRDEGGAVQADGTYAIALKAVDGIYSATVATSAVLDRTVPTATIASPLSGETLSNVRQNGSSSTAAMGTTSDTNLLDWKVSAGPTSESLTVFGTGTTAVSNASLGTWATAGLSNGTYLVRLEVRDRAGNNRVSTTTVTIGHFTASQSAYEFNGANGQTLTYTSVVPFTITQTLTIRNGAGTAVRTLFNGSRAAGTYNDVWDGRDDAGALLADGPYSYVATATEGSNSLTWDLSNLMRETTDTQYPYPSCSAKQMPIDTCEAQALAGRQYDLFANDPLKIHYSVAGPSRVSVVFSDAAETPANCGGPETCVTSSEYRATGAYVDEWAGVLPGGVYATPRSKLTVVRRTSTFPQNVAVLYGSGSPVQITDLTLTPSAFGPEAGPLKIALDLSTFGDAAATLTFTIVRQATSTSGVSTLRTVTLNAQYPGAVTYTWDGKADSGHWVAPGEYALIVSASANGRSTQAYSRFAVIY